MPFPDDLAELATRVNNWGRWGDDDELGTLNLIDGDARRRGLESVVDAQVFNLALPWSAEGPQLGFIEGRINPEIEPFSFPAALAGEPDDFTWHDEKVTMGTQAATHWDGLAHASYRGAIYNGTPDTDMAGGAPRCGIHRVTSLVGRGVLLDLARTAGVDRLDGGTVVGAAELDAAVEAAGLDVAPGDVVLLRTGHVQHFLDGDRMTYAIGAPGPGIGAVEWFHRHDVAAVAIDNLIFEVFPCEREDAFLPVHFLHLVEMGLTQGQNWNLEALADHCASTGRHTFLLEATPDPVVRGFGAPVTPVAIT